LEIIGNGNATKPLIFYINVVQLRERSYLEEEKSKEKNKQK